MAKIEERILSMKFDNAQFKLAASETANALDNLKNKMKIGNVKNVFRGMDKDIDSLGKSAQNVDLSTISNQLKTIEGQWSKVGTIGRTVIGELTKASMRFSSKMMSGIIDPIVNGGMRRARNLEQANFMLNGIINEAAGGAEEVKRIMEDANYGVQDTAYGLDSAAKAAAQFAASGMRSGETMRSTLRGISGVASMTSSSYDDIAQIFTTISGNGKVMTEQLNQMAYRGLNAASTLANSFGVTETELREMVSKGKVSFEDFAKAMDEAYGDQAKASNKTYSGALSNLKAAFSRIGAEVGTKYLENMRDVFNSIRPAVNAAHKAIKPFLGLINNGMKYGTDRVVNFFNSFTAALESFNATGVPTAGWERFFKVIKNIVTVGNLVKDVLLDMFNVLKGGSPRFIEMSESFTENGLKIQHIFRKLLSVVMLFVEIIAAVGRGIFGTSDAFGDLGSSVLDAIDRFAGFLYLMAEVVRQSGAIRIIETVVRKVTKAIVILFDNLIEVVLDFLKFMSPVTTVLYGMMKSIAKMIDQFTQFKLPKINFRPFTDLKSTLKSLVEWFKALGTSIKDMDFGVFGAWARGVKNFFKSFKMESIGPKFSGSLSGFSGFDFSGIRSGASKVGSIFSDMFASLKKVDYRGIGSNIVSSIVAGFKWTGAKLIDFSEWLGDSIGKIDWGGLSDKIGNGLVKALDGVTDFASDALKGIGEFFTNIFEQIKWEDILKGLDNIKDKVGEAFNDIRESIFGKSETAKESALEDVLADTKTEHTVDVVTNVKTNIDSPFGKIGDFWDALFGRAPKDISKEADTILADVSNMGNGIKSVFSAIKNPFGTLTGSAQSEGKSFVDAFKDGVVQAFTGFNIVELLNSAGVFTIGLGLMDFSKALKGFNFKNFLSPIGDGLKSFGEAQQITAKGNAIKSLAISLAILAGSVIALSFVPWEDLKKGMLVLGGLMAMLALLALSLNKIGPSFEVLETGKLIGLGFAMMSIAMGAVTLAGAMMLFSKVDLGAMVKALTSIGLLMAGLWAVSKFGAGQFVSIAMAVGLLAGGLILLAMSLSMLALVPFDTISAGLDRAIAMLIPFVAASMLLGFSQGSLLSFAAGVLVLGAALVGLSVSLMILSTVPWDALLSGLGRASAMIIAFAGMAFLLNAAGGMTIKTAFAIGVFAASLLVLAGSVAFLGSLNFGTALQGVVATIALIAAIGFMLKALKVDENLANTIMTLAKALAILFGIFLVAGFLDPSILMAAGAAMAGFFGILSLGVGLLVAVSNQSKSLESLVGVLNGIAKAFVSVGIAAMMFGAAMLIISMIPTDQLGSSLVAMALGIALMVAALTGLAQVGPKVLVGAVAMMLLATATILLATALNMLSNVEEMGTKLLIFAGAIVFLGVAAAIMGAFAPVLLAGALVIAALGLGAMIAAASVYLFAAALRQLEDIDGAAISQNLRDMGLAVTVMVAAMALFGLVSPFIFLFGISLAVASGAIILFAMALQVLSNAITVFAGSMESFGTIGSAISGFIDRIRGKGQEAKNEADQLTQASNEIKNAAANVDSQIDTTKTQATGQQMGQNLLSGFKSVFGGGGTGVSLESITGSIDTTATQGTGQEMGQNLLTGLQTSLSGGTGSMDFNSMLGLNNMNLDTSGLQAQGAKIPEAIGQGAETNSGAVSNATNNMLSGAAAGTSIDTGMFQSLGIQIPDAIASGVGSDGGQISSASSSAVNNAAGSTDVSSFNQTGTKIPEAVASGIQSNQGVIASSASGAVQSASGSVDTSSFMSVGAAITNGMAAGMDPGPVIAKAQAIAAQAKAAAEASLGIKSPSRVFKTIGKHVVNGFALGMANHKASDNAAEDMASSVIDSAKDTLEVHSPSRVFYGIGMNIAQGLANGLNSFAWQPINALDRMFTAMTGIAAEGMSNIDKLIIMGSKNPFGNKLSDISDRALKQRNDALAKRAKEAEKEKRKIDDEIFDAEMALADYEDQVADNQKAISESRKKIADGNKDDKQEASQDSKRAANAKEDADKKEQELADAKRDLDKKERESIKLARQREDKERAIREARQKKEWYDANIAGYLAGEAFAEGAESGLSDAHETIKTEIEYFVDLVTEEVDELKKEAKNATGLMEGAKSIVDIFTDGENAIMDFTNSFRFMLTSTNRIGFRTNLGAMIDAMIVMNEQVEKAIGLYDKVEPYLVRVLTAFESQLPAILPLINQFAPALGAQLAGGLVKALPAIMGAAGGIIAAVAGIGLFLYDMGKDQKILKVFYKIFDGLVKFITDLPKHIGMIATTMIRGLINLIRLLPVYLPLMVDTLIAGLLNMIDYLPDILVSLFEAVMELVITVLTSPSIIVKTVLKIIEALIKGFFKLFSSLGKMFFNLGGMLMESLKNGVNEGFKRVIGEIMATLKLIRDSIVYALNPFSWGTTPPWANQPNTGGGRIPLLDTGGFYDELADVSLNLQNQLNKSKQPKVEAPSYDYGSRRYADAAIAQQLAPTKPTQTAQAPVSNTYIEYTQNNTSPQPLSAIEIYRNTNKQLSLLKRK